MINRTKCDYEVVDIQDDKVFLVDSNLGNMSITNDAEALVKEINSKYLGKRIIYRDSDECWDELSHINGTFKGYILYTGELPKGY